MATSSNLLSPEELAALASGIDDGTIAIDTGFNLTTRVKKHDLASEDSTLGVNTSSLEMINERFVRLFRLGLMEVLRTSPRINPSRAQIVRFGDYLKDLRPPLAVNTIRINPLRGFSLVTIEPTVVFSALDNFFGGTGSGMPGTQRRRPSEKDADLPPNWLPPTRMFTPTESRVIKIILEVFFRSLKEAWAPLLPVDFEHVGSEINPQFAQIADENDLVIVSRFDTESVGGVKGFVDLVYPYASLKPLRDLLRNRVQADGSEESDLKWRNDLTAAVGDSLLEMQVLLGQVIDDYARVETLKEGDLLFFKKPELATLYIGGLPAFECQVGMAGPNVAVRIENSISPENI
ncbi:MAG: Flagellar motor switch protein FliM [Pseudomonadota bacterium]|jgi:flagellar motor switch protein FliM|nr:flagellar motor switch protein FliM [Oxalobacteraceae bacterium]